MIVNPIGIDRPIQELQELLIDELWVNVPGNQKSFNARVFKNYRNGQLIPEILIEGTNDYKEIAFDDRLSVLSWFDVSDNTSSFDSGQVTQIVGIFFAVNLNDIYPSLDHRTVEESHRDVLNVMSGGSDISGVITGKPAYGDFYSDNLKEYNMQPWHVFRIDYLMKYVINC